MGSNLIYGQEERLLPWAKERIGVSSFRSDAYSIGLERDGDLIAVVVFDGFSECDCNMHIASDGTKRWMNKSLLVSAFAYPFIQLKLRRVTGLVPAKNRQALEFDLNLGFNVEGRHPHAHPDDDIISLGMLKENCRFIRRREQMFDSFDFWADEATDSVTHFERRSRGHRKAETSLRMVEMGRNICFGGKGGGGSSPAPDPQIGAAAMKNAQVGEDWLNFAKEQFAVGNVRQDAMDELTNKVINQQLDTQDQQSKWALEDRTRYQEKFQPLQDEFIDTAKNYDSPERQAQMASEAKADVLKSADAQEQTNKRQMASMGLNPASGRYQGIERAQDLNTALSSAGAQNSARQAVRDKGLALKADAINMGNGLPSQSAAAASLGLNAGNSAVGNSNTANGNWRANVGIVGQGYQGAMQGYANQGNILNNLYGNQVNAWSAQQQANATSSAGLGSLLGTGLAAGVKTGWTFGLSDERLKERVLKVGQLENGIGVYSFEYKQPYKAQWGYGRKLGVMAQEVEKVIPEAVVVCDDGYKLVNYDTVLRKSGVIHGH